MTATGDTLREAAFDDLDAADTFDENKFLRDTILTLGRLHPIISANDLPQWVRDRTNPNRRGRMFNQLAKEGALDEVGSVKSANPKAHGKRVLTYRLVSA